MPSNVCAMIQYFVAAVVVVVVVVVTHQNAMYSLLVELLEAYIHKNNNNTLLHVSLKPAIPSLLCYSSQLYVLT